MKKKISLLLAIILCATLFAAVLPAKEAHATTDQILKIEVTPKKRTMSKPSVPTAEKFTVKITNISDREVTITELKLHLSNNELAYTVISSPTTLSAGSVNTIENVEFYVNDKMVGTTTEVFAEYTGHYEAKADVIIQPKTDTPVASFTIEDADFVPVTVTQEADAKVVLLNGEVNITFTVTNHSDKTITNVALTSYIKFKNNSSLNAKEYRYDEIRPGESQTFTRTVEAKNEFESTGILLYDNALARSNQVDLAPLTVKLQNVDMSFNLVASPKASASYGGKISLIYTLENTGNVSITDIKLFDERGDQIAVKGSTQAFTLKPGESINGEIEIRVTDSKKYKYSLTGKNPQGKQVEYSTNTVEVTLITTPDDIKLDIIVTPSTTHLAETGTVTFTIDIFNRSMFAVSNISLYDEDGRLVKAIASMESGQQQTITDQRAFEVSTNVMYTLVVQSTGQDEKIFESELVRITVGAITTDPQETPTAPPQTETPAPTTTTEPISNGIIGTLLTILYIILALIVLSAGALVLINMQQRKKQRSRNVIRRKIKK